MKLTYLIGEPGVGKSTLMGLLTANYIRTRMPSAPFAIDLLTDMEGKLYAAELGKHRETYSGTDALAFNIMPKACDWLNKPTEHINNLLGEGDRLSSAIFFGTATQSPHVTTFNVVHLTAPPETIIERRQQRGSNQNPSWIKGRTTKMNNLRPWVTHQVDATEPLTQQLETLSEIAL